MVERYYVDDITQFSKDELHDVLQASTPPICLLGGWAVHFHVNEPFRETTGRDYIGSRDIDLGIHVDPESSPEELEDGAVGQTLQEIEEAGFQRSRFGFKKTVDRETGKTLSETEAANSAMHELFEVYIDLLPDRREPENFEKAFGFRPPAEPLLQPVFEGDAGEPLTDHVGFEVAEDVLIADVPVLAAMKARSTPDRDKNQKRVKDIADIHSLLWYVTDIAEVIDEIALHLESGDIERFDDSVSETLIEQAASLISVDSNVVQASTNRLTREISL